MGTVACPAALCLSSKACWLTHRKGCHRESIDESAALPARKNQYRVSKRALFFSPTCRFLTFIGQSVKIMPSHALSFPRQRSVFRTMLNGSVRIYEYERWTKVAGWSTSGKRREGKCEQHTTTRQSLGMLALAFVSAVCREQFCVSGQGHPRLGLDPYPGPLNSMTH